MANAARTPDVGVDEDAILDSLTQEELQKAHDNYEEHKQVSCSARSLLALEELTA